MSGRKTPRARPVVRVVNDRPDLAQASLERTMLAQLRERYPDLEWSIVDGQPVSRADAA